MNQELNSPSITLPDHFDFTDIFFLGPNGAGKGTVGSRLELFGFSYFVTSDVLDYYDSQIPQEEKDQREKGGLMNNGMVLDLYDRYVTEHGGWAGHTVIHDGIPRHEVQSDGFKNNILIPRRKGKQRIATVNFRGVTRETAVERCKKRRDTAIELGQTPRKDDDPVVAGRRYDEAKDRYPSLIVALAEYSDIICVDASAPPNEVFKQVLSGLKLTEAARNVSII